MNLKIFKAYDVRGKYPEEINEKVAAAIASRLPKILGRKILVAHDARLSSPALYKTVLKTLGRQAKPVGLATTPMFYFLVNKLKASGGIMVTASHNPKEYNGLKVVGSKAKPVSGKEILKLVR